MFFQTTRYRIGATIMALSALTLAGCAAFTPATPEQTVEKRATEYWQARMTGKYEKAYELSTPAYRKLRTLEQFRQQFGGGVSVASAEVVSVACEEQKCTARMKIGAKPALVGVKLGTIPMYLDEIWLLEDGQWWHYQES
jgi:hypothetical protein